MLKGIKTQMEIKKGFHSLMEKEKDFVKPTQRH